MPRRAGPARTKLLDAAIAAVRAGGYAAASVEQICVAAGVSKGAFFHHFRTKDDLAAMAARRFASQADEVFRTAPFMSLPDPVDRLLGYVMYRKALLEGAVAEFTCYLGTMIQEIHGTHPELRRACAREIDDHIDFLTGLVADAVEARGLAPNWTARSLATHMQAVLQGAFILAKAENGRASAAASLDHLHTYLRLTLEPARNARG